MDITSEVDGVGEGSRAFKSVLKEEMGQGPLEKDFENFQEDTPKQQAFWDPRPRARIHLPMSKYGIGYYTRNCHLGENLRLSDGYEAFLKELCFIFMISHLGTISHLLISGFLKICFFLWKSNPFLKFLDGVSYPIKTKIQKNFYWGYLVSRRMSWNLDYSLQDI